MEGLSTLVFNIDNKKPIELVSLTKSMLAINAQFDKFNSKKGQNSNARLYVKEVRKGSIIIEMFEAAIVAGTTVLPYVENTSMVVEFASHLKDIYSYFKGENDIEKPELTTKDCEELTQIINPVASDNGSNLAVYIANNKNCNINFNIPSMEANAIQNSIKREKEELKQKEVKDFHTKQILIFSQAVGKIKGNKGIIENLSPKPLGLIFENEEDRNNILNNPNLNPLKYAFLVDVKIEEIANKPVAYRIFKYYEEESFEL